MAEKRYKLIHFDFTRQWAHGAESKTGLTKKQVLKRVEEILDSTKAPKIEIQLWRDAK